MRLRAMTAIVWLSAAACAAAADGGLTVGLAPVRPPWAFVPGGHGGALDALQSVAEECDR